METKLDSSRIEVWHVKHTGFDDITTYYETICPIGIGSFGTVFKMTSLLDNQTWAVKKTDRTQYNPEWETQILSSLSHINIIFVKELIETDNYFFMIMEFCPGGSLREYFEKYGPIVEIEIKYIMKQFGEAVEYLHNRNIAHRDLKMENLLLKDSVIAGVFIDDYSNRLCRHLIKIIDFGLSIKLKKNEEMMLEYCGTPLYMAPEVIHGKSYSKQCDIWSMGIVMLILMLKKHPFAGPETLNSDIISFDIIKNPLPEGLEGFDSQCIEALKGLLNPDPIYRRTAAEFLHFPWLTGEDSPNSMNVLELMKNISKTSKTVDKIEDRKIALASKMKSPALTGQNSKPKRINQIAARKKSKNTK